MIVILGDLLLDLSLRIPAFPVKAEDMQLLEAVELGPGGAANVAIVCARLGLDVAGAGEIGDDGLGRILLEGLRQERIDTGCIQVTAGGATPVAGVLVDARGEPAYLGYPGRLSLAHLPGPWAHRIRTAEAVFADGWIDASGGATLILEAFRAAKEAGVPVFFDPGPGNPRHDRKWQADAAALSTVVLGTQPQIAGLLAADNPRAAGSRLLAQGVQLVVIKRGADGCVLMQADGIQETPAFRVQVVDTTGAGDSLDAAILYGYLRGLSLLDLAELGNAAGAAKVRKWGTGHHSPTVDEIRRVLIEAGRDPFYLRG